MKRLIKTRMFAITFFAVYFSFFVVTVYLLDIKRNGLGVGHLEFGFPFAYYYEGCFGGHYLWIGLFENIIVAGVMSVVAGLAAAHIWSRVNSPVFRAKWYL